MLFVDDSGQGEAIDFFNGASVLFKKSSCIRNMATRGFASASFRQQSPDPLVTGRNQQAQLSTALLLHRIVDGELLDPV